MSGFEIVGIVLGAIPLVISTLEHYHQGVQTIQKWRRYERELVTLIRNLKIERLRLQNVCERLLDGLVPPSLIGTMVENPLADLWYDPKTEKKIRGRLWGSWELFGGKVMEMNDALEDMRNRIGEGDMLQVSENFSIERELKRVRFTLSRSTYSDILSILKDGNSSLESIVSGSIDLEPQRRVRSRAKLSGILRDLSSSMYRAVRSSLSCSTCCHGLFLKLSKWEAGITPGDDEEDIIQQIKFNLAINSVSISSTTSNTSTHQEKESWRRITIQANPIPAEPASSMIISETPSPLSSKKSWAKRKRFEMPSDQSSETTWIKRKSVRLLSSIYSSSTAIPETRKSFTSVTLASLALGINTLSLPGTPSAISLCDKLKRTDLANQPSCYGVVIDETPFQTRSYTAYPATEIDQGYKKNWQLVSLRDVLQRRPGLRCLTYRQRLRLAVLIASNVLQLHKTPWLAKLPSSQNIFLLQSNEIYEDDHTFVVAEQMSDCDHELESISIIRNPTLLALGILLIELSRNQSIDSTPQPEGGLASGQGVLSRYIRAQRLLGDLDQGSSNYRSAVHRCLFGDFQRQKLDLNDDDFRQEVYSSVVALLEEDLRNA